MTKGAALTAGLSPSRVLKDVMTTSSSLRKCKNQNTTLLSQPYPSPAHMYVGCSQPLPLRTGSEHLVPLGAGEFPGPPCPISTTRHLCRKEGDEKQVITSTITSTSPTACHLQRALLPHTLDLGKHWLTRLPCTLAVKQIQTHSTFWSKHALHKHFTPSGHVTQSEHTLYHGS